MSDFTLTALSPLDGYDHEFAGVTLTERTGLALVSIATPMGGKDDLARTVTSAFGIALPDIGFSSQTEDGKARFLGLQRDQMFLLFEYDGDDADDLIGEKLGAAGYYTDQTDSWAVLRISGPGTRTALERLCMLDLSPAAFLLGAVARTTMEHLGVVITRTDVDSFLLMSPRSSAKTFLHAIEASIINTI